MIVLNILKMYGFILNFYKPHYQIHDFEMYNPLWQVIHPTLILCYDLIIDLDDVSG